MLQHLSGMLEPQAAVFFKDGKSLYVLPSAQSAVYLCVRICVCVYIYTQTHSIKLKLPAEHGQSICVNTLLSQCSLILVVPALGFVMEMCATIRIIRMFSCDSFFESLPVQQILYLK